MILTLILSLNEDNYRQLTPEEIKKLVEGQTGTQFINKNDTEQNEEQNEQIPPQPKNIEFFGSSIAHFISKPQENRTSTANSNTEFFFDGPARNAAEIFAKISDKPAQLVSLIGNDSLGQVLKENLQQIGVDCFNLDIDDKLKTSNLLQLQLNKTEIAEQLNVILPENDTSDDFKTVQFNFDLLNKLAYKYLYPKFYDLRKSDLIYSDMLVNQNAIKALINNFANKLVLHFSGVQNIQKYQQTIVDLYKQYQLNQSGKKNKQPFQEYLDSKKVNTIALNIEEFITLINTSDDTLGKQSYYSNLLKQINQINATELLVAKFMSQKSKKESYSDYLLNQKEQIQQLFNLSLKLLNCDNLILFMNPIQTIFANNDMIILSEHSCGKSCIKNNFGNEEAYITGYIAGLYEKDEIILENALEKAGYTQISSLKSSQAVNNNLSSKLLKNYEQKYYVSYKEICTKQNEEIQEQKTEL